MRLDGVMGQLSDVEVAIAAAEAGAAVVRDKFGGQLERYAKSATDFATEADLASAFHGKWCDT